MKSCELTKEGYVVFTREEEEVYIEENMKVETRMSMWKKRLCRLESLKAEPNVKCR